MGVLAKFTKQPSERQDYDIDYRAWLTQCADTAVSYSADVESGMTLNHSTLVDGVVKVWLSGGTSGSRYKVTVSITTAGGRVHEVEIVIVVKEV